MVHFTSTSPFCDVGYSWRPFQDVRGQPEPLLTEDTFPLRSLFSGDPLPSKQNIANPDDQALLPHWEGDMAFIQVRAPCHSSGILLTVNRDGSEQAMMNDHIGPALDSPENKDRFTGIQWVINYSSLWKIIPHRAMGSALAMSPSSGCTMWAISSPIFISQIESEEMIQEVGIVFLPDRCLS